MLVTEDQASGLKQTIAQKLKNAVQQVAGSVDDAYTYSAATVTPDIPVWDSETQGYRDKWGNYSYDGGATWGPKRFYVPPTPEPEPYTPPQQPMSLGQWQTEVENPNDTYTLTGPSFESFNVAGFDTSVNPYDEAMNAQPWWISQDDTPYEIVNGSKQYGEPVPGGGLGSPLNALNDWFFDPIAETGAQLTPSALALGKLTPLAGAIGLGEAATGYNSLESAGAGLQELGAAAKQSGGNPLEFMNLQNQNFDERPWWQQLAASAAFDPTNVIGPTLIAKKTGLIDDAADLFRGATTAMRNSDSIAKVLGGEVGEATVGTPQLVKVGKFAPEVGQRPGALLNPKGIDQLGDFTVDDALVVSRDLTRQTGSVTNRLMAEADAPLRALGPTFKDDAGNLFFKNIPASPAEVDAGMPGALATRVIERPGEYALTPLQRNAVEKIAGIEARVANERELFGVPVNRLAMDEGEQYMHRLALKPSTSTQVDALINEGVDSGKLSSYGAGTRLGSARDKARIYDDPLDAVKDGVVYAHPKEALRQSIETNLKKAADEHVKSLLTPFAQTSADRVPEVLRAEIDSAKTLVKRLEGRLVTAEKRAGINTGKGDALSSMFERQATGAALGVSAPARDIRTVNQFIQRAQQRITTLRQRGGKYAAEARALSDMLDDARLRVADVMPAWEQAKDLSKNLPLGRSTVRQDLAPALIGYDFNKTDAARINAFYSRGIRVGDRVENTSIPGMKGLNAVVVPMRAIGDASATFNQLAMAAVSSPRNFVVNFAKVLRDSVDDANYNRWLAANADDAAKHGVSILGESGARNEFQFGSWIERVPVLRETQKHFTRFGNRMRVDMYNDIAKASTAAGRPLDDGALEQVARSVNRVTGVSNSKATDAETILQFAPNFLRSHLEVIGSAAAKGGIEGSLARQYVRNWATAGMMIVTGTALAQGRDPAEVLTPLDKKALKRGEIKLNPNFGTIRLAGQDIAVFGAYDSLARLAVLGVDSMYRAGNERDARQLFDFVGYAASTKGSPVVQLLTDIIKGETFTGEDPLSLKGQGGGVVSVASSPMAKRFMPFTASGALDSTAQGKSWEDTSLDAALGFFGVKSNPLSPSERLDAKVKADPAFGGRGWYDLSPEEQQTAERKYGALEPFGPEAKASEAERLRLIGLQGNSDTKLARGEMTPEQWRQDYADRKTELRIANDVIYKELRESGQLKTSDKRRAAYYAAIDAAEGDDGVVDWDQVDKYLASLSPEDREYIETNTGLVKIDTPQVLAFEEIYDKIKKSGYFERTDENWKDVSGILGITGFDSYYDWRDAERKNLLDAMGKTTMDVGAVAEIDKWLDKQQPALGMTEFRKRWLEQWVIEHPQEAYHAWQFGYYDPVAEIKKWLRAQFE